MRWFHAVQLALIAARARPQGIDASMEAAVAMINHGHGGGRAEGVALLQRVTEEHPRYAPAHFMLGLLRQQDGSVVAAEASYLRTLELEPTHADARNNLGNIYSAAGDTAAAESHFRAALAIDPNHRMARLNLGLSLHGRGQHDAATAAYKYYLSAVDAHDADFLYNAAVAYQHAGAHRQHLARTTIALSAHSRDRPNCRSI